MTADDLALTAARFGAALRHAGVPADPARCARFARAVSITLPTTLHQLYLCALATLISGKSDIGVLERVFNQMFAGLADEADGRAGPPPTGLPRSAYQHGTEDLLARAARAAKDHAPAGLDARDVHGGDGAQASAQLVPVADGTGEDAAEGDDASAVRPVLASRAERLAAKDFAELTPAELKALAGIMRKLTLAVPLRRSRRHRHTPHGQRTDLRATLRQARRTGGHPLRLHRRAPSVRPRQLIVLCDISGSMEPYARAMLQFLYCAAGGAQAEIFTFATRLTRLTGTLAHSSPELALERAGRAAPDWLGGTRIGASLKEFNDTRGRRGLARGAIVVIISDGWDTGDPAVLGHEMQRLSRVAHRIVWVNPRTKSEKYQPLAGGMAAAWPYCDAVLSAHSVHALDDLAAALARAGRHRPSSIDGTRQAPC
jgi:hypothetical protein